MPKVITPYRGRPVGAGAAIPIRERVSPLRQDEWSDDAACRHTRLTADAWFPVAKEDPLRDRAKEICGFCPVRDACLAEALAVPGTHGIWGGLDESERKSLVRRAKRAGASRSGQEGST